MQLCALFLFVFLSGSVVFAQESPVEISLNEASIGPNGSTPDGTSAKASASGINNSNVNFILWFMGTRENLDNTVSNGAYYSRKSILTSGRVPNHLLMKTLLKKAINVKSC